VITNITVFWKTKYCAGALVCCKCGGGTFIRDVGIYLTTTRRHIIKDSKLHTHWIHIYVPYIRT